MQKDGGMLDIAPCCIDNVFGSLKFTYSRIKPTKPWLITAYNIALASLKKYIF